MENNPKIYNIKYNVLTGNKKSPMIFMSTIFPDKVKNFIED